MTYADALEVLGRHLGDQWQNDGEIRFGSKVRDRSAIDIYIHDVPEFMFGLITGVSAAITMYRMQAIVARQVSDPSEASLIQLADSLKSALEEITAPTP